MKTFTGLKDVDRHILLLLSDTDLMECCSVNKYFFSICDDKFFYSKLYLCYPETLSYYRISETYKLYFLKVSYYIYKMRRHYGYSYIGGDCKKQFSIFKNIKLEIHYLHLFDKTLLFEAATKGEIYLVKYCIGKEKIIENITTAACMAANNNQLEVVKYLVNLGADIFRNNNYALVVACEKGYLEIVKYLVESGANIHVHNDEPLKWAKRNGHWEIENYLKNYAIGK
jgi:hypothetical protein